MAEQSVNGVRSTESIVLDDEREHSRLRGLRSFPPFAGLRPARQAARGAGLRHDALLHGDPGRHSLDGPAAM